LGDVILEPGSRFTRQLLADIESLIINGRNHGETSKVSAAESLGQECESAVPGRGSGRGNTETGRPVSHQSHFTRSRSSCHRASGLI
jgi:hypothetical protein